MFLKAEDIVEAACPQCGQPMEFWPDEPMRKCRACGQRLVNPGNSMKCLEWCRYAAQCLAAVRGGDESWIGPLRAELIERMKRTFGADQRRIAHALAVLARAEEVGREAEAEALVVVPAAILHDIGFSAPEVAGNRAEHGVEGRRIAAELLRDLRMPRAIEEEILDLIEHHHDRAWMDALRGAAPHGAATNGAVLFDADLIVNLAERPAPEREELLDREALTEAGRRIGKANLT
jgi:putative nucleotidyltransferase with HDIG domain